MSRILFKKEGRAKFISHLDLMRTMQRAFIRAGVPIKHTEGFNPHPYMTFAMPLSVGTESVCELMDFVPVGELDHSGAVGALNGALPEGIRILECYEGERKFKDIKWLDIEAGLYYDNEMYGENELREFFGSESIVIEKKTKRSSAAVDIKPLIAGLEVTRGSGGVIAVRARLAAQDPALSPAQLVSAIGQRRPRLMPDFAAFKRIEVYDGDMARFR